jgi:hypothetical protein
MSAARNLDELSPEVQEEIKLLAVRVTQGFPAFRSLKAILTDREWRQIETELERYFPSLARTRDAGTLRPAVAASADRSRSQSAEPTSGCDTRTPKKNSSPLAASGPLAVESKGTPAAVPLTRAAKFASAVPAPPANYAIKTLMRLRKLSQCRAILELSLANDLLTDVGYRRLLREIGGGEPEPRPTKRPSWDATTGTLWFENAVLRTFKSQARAKNLVALLEAFENRKWIPRIPNPLNSGQQIHDAVQGLNRGRKKIVFHVEDDGRQISWRRH